MIDTNKLKIKEFLERGVEAVFPNKEFLESRMLKGEKLSLYLGIDPTGPTIHMGHLIPIRKLAEFQKLGHQIILLIGDFTAMIGDPDKLSVRVPLTREQILENLREYKKQVSRFINFDGDNPALFKFNSEWLSKLNFGDILELTSKVTVDQMLKRDMFKKRMEEGRPIYVHEFMYPLMQGYDSVAMDVDGEIGGNDQTFNMLAGRDLLKLYKNKEKFVITTKLLADPSGKKMGKSEGNMIALNQDPSDCFGKVMSWPDTMIIPSFELLTDLPKDKIEEFKNQLNQGHNPKDIKVELAKEIISICFGQEFTIKAEENFKNTFSEGGIPEDILEVSGEGKLLIDVCLENKLVDSKTEFKRLVDEKAITLESGEIVGNWNYEARAGVYKIGKRRFIKIK